MARWTVEVDGPTSARAIEPSAADRIKEWQIEMKRRDKEERLERDPIGLGVWGVEETIDEVVRRQNEK
jgi:hypothetical protein